QIEKDVHQGAHGAYLVAAGDAIPDAELAAVEAGRGHGHLDLVAETHGTEEIRLGVLERGAPGPRLDRLVQAQPLRGHPGDAGVVKVVDPPAEEPDPRRVDVLEPDGPRGHEAAARGAKLLPGKHHAPTILGSGRLRCPARRA